MDDFEKMRQSRNLHLILWLISTVAALLMVAIPNHATTCHPEIMPQEEMGR